MSLNRFYHDLDGRFHGFFYDGSSYLTIDNPLGVGSTPSPLDPPGILGTMVFGLNNLGAIVGGYADENDLVHGFIYRNGVYTTIDNPLGEYGTTLFGVNDVGQVVGSYIDATGSVNGFVYDGVQFTRIHDPDGAGFLGTVATSINNSGVVVGYYDDAAGYEHAFMATPVPEPSSGLMLATAISLALASKWYRRNRGFVQSQSVPMSWHHAIRSDCR